MAKRVRRAQPPPDSSPPERSDLLERILSTPHVARAVPQLPAQVLHRVIQHCGLADCGELVALASPGQLARVFDLDLWRPAAPGLDEQFDAGRFGTWLEVMVDAGVSSAAATLAAMEADLLAVGFVEHVRVFDAAAVAPYITLEGDLAPGAAFADGERCEVGGYVVQAKRRDCWEAITAVLAAMAAAHADVFTRIMRGCCRQSNSRPEIDGLDDLLATSEQAMFDVARDREARRDAQGFVTPAQARAFLHRSRHIEIRTGTVPPPDPIARAYFRDADRVEPVQDAPVEAVAAIVDLLREAGVMPDAAPPRRALLADPQPNARLARIRALLLFAYDHDPEASAMRSAELAYLANVIAAGASVQSRPMTAEEASNAALAVCNLGLDNWSGERPEDLLIRHDLVSVFQVGWTVLHEDVCMYAADTLVSILSSLRSGDGYVQPALDDLRVKLIKYCRAGSPWDAREALDVIAILDTPAWAALLGLIDQLPTLHAAVGASLAGTTRQIAPHAFEFISENAQIQQVREFMQRLPQHLCS
jgi:hypothetical protein